MNIENSVKMEGSEPSKTMNNSGTWPEQSDESGNPSLNSWGHQNSQTHLLPEGKLDIGMSNIRVGGVMKADGSGDRKPLPNGQENHHCQTPPSKPLQKSISAILPAITPLVRYAH